MKNLFVILLSMMILIGINACSTVMHSTTQNVEFKTNPSNAKIIVDGKKYGTSPQYVNLDRGTNHNVKFELDGYELYETQLTRKISGWFWFNAFNGFIPGMVTDMFTGSMYNLLPESLEVELTPAKVVKEEKKRRR